MLAPRPYSTGFSASSL